MHGALLWSFLSVVLTVCSATPDFDPRHGVVADLLARHNSRYNLISVPPKEKHVEEDPVSSPKRHSSRPQLNRQGGNRWQRDESTLFEHRPWMSKVQLNRQKAVNLDRPRQKSWSQSELSRQDAQRWRRDLEVLESGALFSRAVDAGDQKSAGIAKSDSNTNGDQSDSTELPPPPKSINTKQQSAAQVQEPLDYSQTPSSYNTPKSGTSPWHVVSKNGKDSLSGSPSPLRSPTKQANSPKGHETPGNKEFGNKGQFKSHKYKSLKADQKSSLASSPRSESAQQGKDSHPRRGLNAEHIFARLVKAPEHDESDDPSGHHRSKPSPKFARQYAGRYYPARRAIPDAPLSQDNAQPTRPQAAQTPFQGRSKQCPGNVATSAQSAEISGQHHCPRSADAERASHVGEPNPPLALSSKDKSTSNEDRNVKAKEKAAAKKEKAKHRKARKHKKKKAKHTSTSKDKGVSKKKSAAERNKTGQKNSEVKKKKKLLKNENAAKDKSKTKVDETKKAKDAAGEKQTSKEKAAAKKVEDKEKQDDRKEDEKEKKKEADDDKREKKLEKESDAMDKDHK